MSEPPGGAALLTIPDSGQRDELAEFIARVVQLEPASLVRLGTDLERVVAWATTPFEVLATRAVRGELAPADVTVSASELLAALAVVRHSPVDPGSRADARWRAELPPGRGWRAVAGVRATDLAELAEAGLAEARAREEMVPTTPPTAHGSGPPLPPTEVLDLAAYAFDTDLVGARRRVAIPLRCLFALSGLGLLDHGGVVRVEVTEDGGWLRLASDAGAVVRRRRVLLPLV